MLSNPCARSSLVALTRLRSFGMPTPGSLMPSLGLVVDWWMFRPVPGTLGCRDLFYSQTLACSQCSCNILKQVARCIHTLKGHHTEIVCVAFNVQARQELLHLLLQAQIRWRSQGTHVATGSMDNTAKLWDVFSSERSLYQDLGETESRERRDMAGVRVKLFPCKVETGHQIASLEGHSVMLSENYPSCFVSLAFLRPR